MKQTKIGTSIVIFLFLISFSFSLQFNDILIQPSDSNTTYSLDFDDVITNLTINETHVNIDNRTFNFESKLSTANIIQVKNSSNYYQIFMNFESGSYTYDADSIVFQNNNLLETSSFDIIKTTDIIRYNEPSQNYVYFNDSTTSLPLVNNSVIVTYPDTSFRALTTDSLGKVEFNSYYNDNLQEGEYTFIYSGNQGFASQSINYTPSTIPFNVTYNISRANLTINVKDAVTEALITDNTSITITDIGTFTTTTGTLFLENLSYVSGSYTIYVSSENYTFNQKTITFTNQEELEVSIFVFDKDTTNLGNVVINTYDSFLDIVPSADVRLQEYNPVTGSFVETGQRETNSNGQATFQVLLESKSYRWYVTALIDGISYETYSTEGGEIIYSDGTSIDVYLNTITDIGGDYSDNLRINTTNSNLVNNISYHTVDFYDSTGVDHTICLGYYYIDGVVEKTSLEICEVGSSGTLAQVGGRDLTALLENYRVRVRVFVNETGTVYYEQAYTGDNSFESQFGDLIKPLIMIGTILALAVALALGRIDIFVYINIFFGILWTAVAPSYMTGGNLALNIIMGLAILYLAKQRNGVQSL